MTRATPTMRSSSGTATAIRTRSPEKSCPGHWARTRQRNISRRTESHSGEKDVRTLGHTYGILPNLCCVFPSASDVLPTLSASSQMPKGKVSVLTKQEGTSINNLARSQCRILICGVTEAPCNSWSPCCRNRLQR